MSVDVEDWYQVSAFEKHIERADWPRLESRVRANVERILELFEQHGVRATFFVLGWIAEREPGLVAAIAAAGHEIASHGWQHVRVIHQDPDAFRADARDTRALLQDQSGQPVDGYRAASYSIGRDNLWALDVLGELGHRYSSSIYPIRHDLYGMPEAPRFRFHPNGTQLVEVPVTTVEFAGRRMPCGGGGFFRLYPYAFSRWALRRVNRVDGESAVFYFHPWEIDPAQPRPTARLPARTRLRHYLNLGRMQARLAQLCGDFRWDRMDRVFLPPAGA
ncbi:MAG: DUF3473 domain-containing protein [Chromatiales bacterium]|nr:DUF3473 domain-containing protein [Chromatiales bacterium]